MEANYGGKQCPATVAIAAIVKGRDGQLPEITVK